MSVSQFRMFSIRCVFVTLSVLACAVALSASSANADMLVFWDFDQSYNDGSDYVMLTAS